MKPIFLFLLLSLSLNCWAVVEVAFIEVRDQNGKLLQLEVGGRFAEIAISYRGGWLHAHPQHGVIVETRAEVERAGQIKATVTVPGLDALDEHKVEKYVGKPFDPYFSWTDDRIYNAELVAKLLGIRPLPMNFDAPIWPPSFRSRKGEMGLSADDIFKEFQKLGLAVTLSP